MPQTLTNGGAAVVELDACQPNPIAADSVDINLTAGERWRWKLCFCGDRTSLSELNPGAQTAELSSAGCIQTGDAIKVWCHNDGCEEALLNGEHVVTGVAGDVVTLAGTDMTALGTAVQTFTAQNLPVGCPSASAITPPGVCHLRPLDDITFRGLVTNRIPGDEVRTALTAFATLGSDIIFVSDLGQVHQGDVFTAPGAGFNGANVLRVWREQANVDLGNGTTEVRLVDYVKLDATSTYSGCVGASTEVGVLAEFEFGVAANGCVEVTLPPSFTTKMLPRKEGGGLGCKPGCYEVGTYSIFAEYYSDRQQVESARLVSGCVYYCPNSVSEVA